MPSAFALPPFGTLFFITLLINTSLYYNMKISRVLLALNSSALVNAAVLVETLDHSLVQPNSGTTSHLIEGSIPNFDSGSQEQPAINHEEFKKNEASKIILLDAQNVENCDDECLEMHQSKNEIKEFTSTTAIQRNLKRDDQTYTTGWNIYFRDVTVSADTTITNTSTVTSETSVTVETTSTTTKKTTSSSSSTSSSSTTSSSSSSSSSTSSSSNSTTKASTTGSSSAQSTTEMEATTESSTSESSAEPIPSVSSVSSNSRNGSDQIKAVSGFSTFILSLLFLL